MLSYLQVCCTTKMIPEIEDFLNKVAESLGIKRLAISFIVDHLGYAVKIGDIRAQISSLDVDSAVESMKLMAEITKEIRRHKHFVHTFGHEDDDPWMIKRNKGGYGD